MIEKIKPIQPIPGGPGREDPRRPRPEPIPKPQEPEQKPEKEPEEPGRIDKTV